MIRDICVGGIYKHFKGNCYVVEGIGYDAETTATLVIYVGLYEGGKRWIRPLDEFLGEVDHEKYPNVEQKYRFELISHKYINNLLS